MAEPIAVIGAGLIGLSTAYYLRRDGADVVVVERRHPGSGASLGNAGWIVPSMTAPVPGPGILRTAVTSVRDPDGALFVPPAQLPRLLPWGLRFVTHCTRSRALHGLHATARLAKPTMQLYDDLRTDGVAFDMRSDGVLEVFETHDQVHAAAASLQPLASYGFGVPEVVTGAELQELEPALGPAARAGLLLREERAVHPGSLVEGLADRLRSMNVPLLNDWPVEAVDVRSGVVRAISGPRGELPVSGVVVAAGTWSSRLLRTLGCRVALKAGKGYSLSAVPDVLPSRPVYLSRARVGVTPFGDRVRLAGTMELAGFDEQVDQRRIDALLRSAQPFLAGWDPASVQDGWAGLRPMTPDGLPVIGPVPGLRNAYAATGHAMLGVTLAPATGRAIADLIAGRGDADLLAPFRIDRPGARAILG